MTPNQKIDRMGRLLMDAESYLRDLSRALAATGNEHLAAEMKGLSESLAEARKLATDAHVEEIKDRLHAAQDGVGMILSEFVKRVA